ncbi:MAG TPA: TetR/AcrR family transcriptional regulator [Ktedonobacteraceae bacterium]|jgi:AcrR family transcriptional regulator|nr:TetR/AcrR family transcriptional regulator [Ktedonobacteraceae bacterium]
MPTSTHAARQRILETAQEMFYQEGIHAVGIDTIIERSGVAKATLYYHFASKEALIEAYLQERDRAFWVWFEQAISGEREAKGKLLAFFDALLVKVSAPDYRGCGFLNCAAEFPHEGQVGHTLPRATKHKLRQQLLQLSEGLKIEQPAVLADQLVLLAEGSFASSPMFDAPGPATHAREAARILIEAHRARGLA